MVQINLIILDLKFLCNGDTNFKCSIISYETDRKQSNDIIYNINSSNLLSSYL